MTPTHTRPAERQQRAIRKLRHSRVISGVVGGLLITVGAFNLIMHNPVLAASTVGLFIVYVLTCVAVVAARCDLAEANTARLAELIDAREREYRNG